MSRINHIQTFCAHGLEAGHDVVYRSLHDALTPLVTGEIEIEMLAHETIRNAGEAVQRVLDTIAKELAPKQVIIERHAERELHRRVRSAVPELQVVFPAGIKELPLKVSHLDKLGAILLLHPCILERNEERRNKGTLSVAQIVKEVERLSGVCIGLSRQSDDESAEGEPVVLIEGFHALEHHVAPLMGLVGISFALHENIEEARAAGFQTDDWISHAMIGISR